MTGPSATFGFRDVDASEKAGLVRGVFDRVAKRYDLMNDLMSGGVHRLWKDAVAARLNPQPGEVIVDCAGGTGDMARRFSKMARRVQERRGGDDARVFVVDYNAEMIMAGIEKGGEPEITAGLIIAQTAAYFGLSIEELTGPSRGRHLVMARQIAMYLCRELTDLSLPKIGQQFGNRDHTTVLHAIRKIEQLMNDDNQLREEIELLKRLLRD